jgi:hypothetical protein
MTLRLRPRHLWIVPGLAIAVYASGQAQAHAIGIVPLLIFTIVPDLPRLLGIGQPHAHGQLAPRAVPLFNLLHHPVLPLAVVALAAAGFLSPFWLVGAIAWLGHLVIGLGIGDRLRTPDGFLRSHWIVDLLPSRRGEFERSGASTAAQGRA